MRETQGQAGADRTWRRACQLVAVLGVAAWSRPSSAIDTGLRLGDENVNVAVTESSSLVYNGDNRNSRDGDVASAVDDAWSVWYNRLILQHNAGRLTLTLRVDSALFLDTKSPAEVALELTERSRAAAGRPAYNDADAELFLAKFRDTGADQSSRFISWNYPAKYQLGYEMIKSKTARLKATLGDFTAQFGRGLVLSVRKNDELQSDTSIRGVRVDGELKAESLTFGATALAGTMNPLRIDPASGRVLGVTSEVVSGVAHATEFGMPRAISTDFEPRPRPNFAPDSVGGVELSARRGASTLSVAALRLIRPCVPTEQGCQALGSDQVRAAQTSDVASVALDLPALSPAGGLYAELAIQRLDDLANGGQASNGQALYIAGNAVTGPVVWTLEGKHYRRFFPLRASVDLGRAREFSQLAYSTPPTTEPVWNDTEFEGFNTCVTGGRAKADLRVSRASTLFAWLAHYATWGESGAAGRCDVIDESRNSVWDAAEGFEIQSAGGRSHLQGSFGTRFDSTYRELIDGAGQRTHVFYRELYTRFDAVKALTRDVSIQLLGYHRRRRQTLGGPRLPWFQGQTSLAVHIGQSLSLGSGFDYTQNPAFPSTYVHGLVRYNLSANDNLSVFVGQQQGGLRCVSGICRVFPPFAGARLDATFRF